MMSSQVTTASVGELLLLAEDETFYSRFHKNATIQFEYQYTREHDPVSSPPKLKIYTVALDMEMGVLFTLKSSRKITFLL